MAKERIINAAFMLQLFAFLAPPTLRGKESRIRTLAILAGNLPVKATTSARVDSGNDAVRLRVFRIGQNLFPWPIPVKDQQTIDGIPYRPIDFRFRRDRCDCGPNRIVQNGTHPLYRFQKCGIVAFLVPVNRIEAGNRLRYGERTLRPVVKARYCPVVGSVDPRHKSIVDEALYPFRVG